MSNLNIINQLSDNEDMYNSYLEDNKKAVFLGTENELENQKLKIIDQIQKIKNSEFDPTPGWQCQYCDFKDICDFAQQ
jgi:CRISPR/Cas system-associated exonuclease Cas4 (RecB family)